MAYATTQYGPPTQRQHVPHNPQRGPSEQPYSDTRYGESQVAHDWDYYHASDDYDRHFEEQSTPGNRPTLGGWDSNQDDMNEESWKQSRWRNENHGSTRSRSRPDVRHYHSTPGPQDSRFEGKSRPETAGSDMYNGSYRQQTFQQPRAYGLDENQRRGKVGQVTRQPEYYSEHGGNGISDGPATQQEYQRAVGNGRHPVPRVRGDFEHLPPQQQRQAVDGYVTSNNPNHYPPRSQSKQEYMNRNQNVAFPPQDSLHRPRSRNGVMKTNPVNVPVPPLPVVSPRAKPAHPVKPAKQRIAVEPSSPETLSWDNPFPTFPNIKKKPQKGMDDLNKNLAETSLREDAAQSEGALDLRSQTASSKSSHESSRSHEKRFNGAIPNQQIPSHYDDYVTNDNAMNNHQHQKLHSRPDDPRPEYSSTEVRPQTFDNRWQFQQVIQRQHPSSAGRKSEEVQRKSVPASEAEVRPSLQRSMTMPNELPDTGSTNTSTIKATQTAWVEPGPIASYHGPDNQDFLPIASTDFLNHDRQAPLSSSAYHTTKVRSDNYDEIARAPRAPVHNHQNNYGVGLDSYYGIPDGQHRSGDIARQTATPTVDMPNFDNMADEGAKHRRGTTIDKHMPMHSQQSAMVVPPIPNALSEVRYYPETKDHDQYDLRQAKGNQGNGRNDLSSKIAGDGSVSSTEGPPVDHLNATRRPMHGFTTMDTSEGRPSSRNDRRPLMSVNTTQGRAIGPKRQTPIDLQGRQNPMGPQSSDQVRQFEHPGPRQGSIQSQSPLRRPSPADLPSPRDHTPQISPLGNRPLNPDILPQHPMPIRPGLLQSQSAIPVSAARPPPARQYNIQSTQQPVVAQNPRPNTTSREQRSKPVTPEELERLRQAAKANPSDQATQLLLVKRMVEAASVLADDGGRADQKQKQRNRENYIFGAHKLLKKLVSSGYPEAMFYSADCHGRGLLGLQVDMKEAFLQYQSAAKLGHPQSAYRVAVCCEMGQEEGGGTKRDPLKAIQWYKRAATLGDIPAMYKMGIIQLKGLLGQPRNNREAISWLKRAAERADEENPHALHELALLYESANGDDSIVKDEGYSLQLFRQAADLGYKFSQYRLGCAYEYGSMGCPIDPRHSIAWYSRAAVQEEHQSELALSGWYLTGSEGVLKQSDTEAYLWARKAAQAGLAKAEYAMGYFTEVGIGAPANIDDAKRWYWRAASQDFPKARERLEELRKGGAKMQKSRVSRSAVTKQKEGDCSIM